MEGKLLPGPSLKLTTMKVVPFSSSFTHKKRKKKVLFYETIMVLVCVSHLRWKSINTASISVNFAASPTYIFAFWKLLVIEHLQQFMFLHLGTTLHLVVGKLFCT